MKTANFFSVLLLGLLLLTLQSCNNAGCTDPNSLNYDPEAVEDNGKCAYPTLNINFKYKFGDEDLMRDDVYTYNGTALSFKDIQFYVANPRVAVDGVMEATNEIYFISFDHQTIEMSDLTAGHKHMFMFGLGVDSVTNKTIQPSDPDLEEGAALGPQVPTMHWGWDNGYIFFKLDGLIDTDGDNTPDDLVEMHIGKDFNFQNIALEIHTDALQETVDVTIDVDISKVFEGVDLQNDYVTHTGDNPALAKTITTNLGGIFSKN